MDYYLECAIDRLTRDKKYAIPHGTIHECSKTFYERCKSGVDQRCLEDIQEAAILSYCAPLKDLPYFSWSTADEHGVDIASAPSHGAITVLRNPVDRVWSMFRFQTRSCFRCKPLKDIYEMMDNGNFNDMEETCYQQLQNHQVANLLSTEWNQQYGLPGWQNATGGATNEEEGALLAEAIQNMKSFFTVIGITEHLDETIEIAGSVFPWMKPHVDWSDHKCELAHANASPRNNGCGPGNSHWDLPDHPDDETRAAIEAHNQLDLKLYAAAVEHFELQRQAVGMGERKH